MIFPTHVMTPGTFACSSDAQPVFRGTPVCRENFKSHYNYNHNEINNYKNSLNDYT
jgi:hypothetical protein